MKLGWILKGENIITTVVVLSVLLDIVFFIFGIGAKIGISSIVAGIIAWILGKKLSIKNKNILFFVVYALGVFVFFR